LYKGLLRKEHECVSGSDWVEMNDLPVSTKMKGHTTFSELKWNYFGYYLGNIILMYEEEETGKAK
jgi:hypothetical protein